MSTAIICSSCEPLAWIVRSKTTWHVAISLIAISVMSIAKQCMNMYAKQTSRMISPSGSGALGKCDQCMIIKESIWSQQKVTKSGKSKCHEAARVGINPTPTVAECCKRFVWNVVKGTSLTNILFGTLCYSPRICDASCPLPNHRLFRVFRA